MSNQFAAVDLPGWSPPQGPPPMTHWLREWTVALQPARLALHLPRLARAPRGDGGLVLTVPGIHSPELAMAPIGAYLRWLGHDVAPWGLGTNRGDVDRDVDQFAEVVARHARRRGRPVAIVGWSLGGWLGREVARRHPDAVRHVVTYGTPAVGGPAHTVGAHDLDDDHLRHLVEDLARKDAANPIRVPLTVLVSRNDGIVDWRAQVDVTSRDVSHVEVGSSHLGFGLDPEVWLAAAGALAA